MGMIIQKWDMMWWVDVGGRHGEDQSLWDVWLWWKVLGTGEEQWDMMWEGGVCEKHWVRMGEILGELGIFKRSRL